MAAALLNMMRYADGDHASNPSRDSNGTVPPDSRCPLIGNCPGSRPPEGEAQPERSQARLEGVLFIITHEALIALPWLAERMELKWGQGAF